MMFGMSIPAIQVGLMAQMAVKPKPAKVETETVKVQIVHDGKFAAFRLRWADKRSQKLKLGVSRMP